MTRRVLTSALAAALLTGLVACGPGEGTADDPEPLTVFAAASLGDAFTRIGAAFEAEHDDVAVTFGFGGSSDLATQIRSGAPADVFASADEATMARVADAGAMSGNPQVFATNTLTIAVAEGNPHHVDDLAALTSDDLDVVVCAPVVPCGAAAATVEKTAGLELEPVSEEQDVTGVLTKVAAGEADAGLVYVTDLARAEGVSGVDLPESASAVNRYPIGVVEGSEHAGVARQFVDFVLGERGRRILAEAGFGRP